MRIVKVLLYPFPREVRTHTHSRSVLLINNNVLEDLEIFKTLLINKHTLSLSVSFKTKKIPPF